MCVFCQGAHVIDSAANAFAYAFSAMFVIGVAGCLFVTPITAYRLFSVLFDPDRPGEE